MLQPPRVHATRLPRVGKETNPLADGADLILNDSERAVEYRELRCRECGNELRGRQRLWCSEKCRKRAFGRSSRRKCRRKAAPNGAGGSSWRRAADRQCLGSNLSCWS
jgi:hypothetical protein